MHSDLISDWSETNCGSLRKRPVNHIQPNKSSRLVLVQNGKMMSLRSKLGCERCRLRRKKCDERKPICENCERLKLVCTWSARRQALVCEDNTLLSQPMGDVDPLRPHLFYERVSSFTLYGTCITSLLYSGYAPFYPPRRTPRIEHITSLYENHVVDFHSKRAHMHATEEIYPSEHEIVMNALATFSFCVLVTMNVPNSSSLESMLSTYEQTLLTLHRHLQVSDGSDKSMAVLISTNFLGLVEVSSPDSSTSRGNG